MPINQNKQTLFLGKFLRIFMSRTIFIREIILTPKEPKLCPTCEKEDRLERDVVFERRSDGKTIMCTRCEALIVITNHNLKKVELEVVSNSSVMLKEPHLIRKITY